MTIVKEEAVVLIANLRHTVLVYRKYLPGLTSLQTRTKAFVIVTEEGDQTLETVVIISRSENQMSNFIHILCCANIIHMMAIALQNTILMLLLFVSLRKKYGRVFSLKIGSYKVVMASTPEAIREMLATKSTDYAGRQQAYSLHEGSLGGYKLQSVPGEVPLWR